MAPKKKGGKKQQEEDWEAELGESAPTAQESQAPADANGEANGDGDGDEMGGGLLAALKKNRSKKAKKGKNVDNDWVEGEDPTQADTNGDAAADLASKAPQEGSFEDEEDVFSGKPKATKPAPKAQPKQDDEEGGKLKSKKEKEKEKKEREKQRKKEQVCQSPVITNGSLALLTIVITYRPRRKKPLHPLNLRNKSQPRQPPRSTLRQLRNQPKRPSQPVRRRSFRLTSLPFRNNKKL